jgi:hypothetical protein
MTTLGKTTAGIFLATCAIGGSPAIADDEPYVPASVYGISVTVGGGVHDFTDESMRDTTDPGGIWDVRGVLGTRSPIAVEAAYVGTAQGIDARFGEETTATLVGTGLEGALRVNVLPFEVFTPYAFAGLGWKRYDVAGADFRTADTGINDEDTLLEVPMGGGLAFRDDGFLVDGRFTYRAAVGEDLVISDDALPGELEEDAGALGMDNWSVSARVGFEF